MKESLELKLHNYLRERPGKMVPYSDIKHMVENVWLTPQNGHYRMETLTRRARKDNTKGSDISNNIGKIFQGNAITHFYYKDLTSTPQYSPVTREIYKSPLITKQDYCCFSSLKFTDKDGRPLHDNNCEVKKRVEITKTQEQAATAKLF